MSYTPPPSGYLVPAAPGSVPRPGAVTVSALLLYVVSVALVLSAAISVYAFSSLPEGLVEDIYREAGMAADLASTTASIVVITTYVVAGVYVLLAAFFVVLGMFVGRGKQWARITTWVFAGIGLCCVGFGLLSQSAGGSFGTSGSGAGIDQERAAERLTEAMPSWSTPVGLLLSVVMLLSMLAAIILLALPASNAFFRKPAPEWTPPAYPTV
ncbi:hypothetical protein [Catellatospora methionotrophica]|uniref:hypothetical protein n=1 Tax=Catellatospora methionotrophica TaxID=121620 RepID=UPI0033D791BE